MPPDGIFPLLDDACSVAGTDETYLAKIKQKLGNNPLISVSSHKSIISYHASLKLESSQ
jgi:myosin heavy subunit